MRREQDWNLTYLVILENHAKYGSKVLGQAELMFHVAGQQESLRAMIRVYYDHQIWASPTAQFIDIGAFSLSFLFFFFQSSCCLLRRRWSEIETLNTYIFQKLFRHSVFPNIIIFQCCLQN